MRRNFLPAAILFVIIAAVFFPVTRARFVQWDDDINIYGNPHIQSLNAENLKWMFTDCSYTPRYRPLNWLAWATLYHFFGANAAPYHVVALVLHAFNAVLVFLLIKTILFRRALAGVQPSAASTESNDSPITLAAVAGALLWALHPLRVEVVAWTNCQIYTQSLFFLLLSLLCYFRATQTGNDKPPIKRASYWLSVLFFTLSLLTYPTAVGFVVVLVVIDVFLLNRLPLQITKWSSPESRKVLLEKVPFAAATLASVGITLWARANMSGMWTETSALQNFGWPSRIVQAFYVWAYYAWKPLLPLDLSPVYTQLVSFRPTDWPFVLSSLAIIGVTVWLIVQRSRWPSALALWICHLVLLVPMLGLTEHPHYTNDRYSYIVNILLAMLLAAALSKLTTQKFRFAGLFVCAGLGVALGVASFRQTLIWQNSPTLFQAILKKLGNDPYRCDVLWRLGLYYAREGQNAEAMKAFSEAVKIKPDFYKAHSDMAAILFSQGKLDEAAMHYQEVLRSHPNHPMANFNLGLIFDKQGKAQEAAQHFLTAAKAQPENAEFHLNLAVALGKLGRNNEASDEIFTAVKLNPKSPEANFNAGNVMMMQQKVGDALGYFSKAVELKPTYAEAHYNFGTVLAMIGKVDQALPHFSDAAKYKPDFAEAHFSCGMALAQLGKAEEAKKKYQTALLLANASGRRDLAAQIEAQMQGR